MMTSVLYSCENEAIAHVAKNIRRWTESSHDIVMHFEQSDLNRYGECSGGENDVADTEELRAPV